MPRRCATEPTGSGRPRVWLQRAAAVVVCLTVGAAHLDAAAKPAHAATCATGAPVWGMMGPDRRAVPLAVRLGLYRQLGLGWIRINASVPGAAAGITSLDDIAPYQATGLRVLLTVTAPALQRDGASDADYATYASQLRGLLQQYHPAMIAVENEADNLAIYPGSAGAYLHELKTACAVAHAGGVPCTDSGFTSKMLIALLIDDFELRGDQQDADRYGHFLRLWFPMHFQLDPTGSDLIATLQRDGVGRARRILVGLKAAGADRVDMHWYTRTSPTYTRGEQQQQIDLLRRVIAMLRATTGLPVAAGEVGLDRPHGDDATANPIPFEDMMYVVAGQGAAPIIVWNPGTGLFPANPNARSLVDASGGVLPLGRAMSGIARSHPIQDHIASCG